VDLNQQHPSVTSNDYSLRTYPNWAACSPAKILGFAIIKRCKRIQQETESRTLVFRWTTLGPRTSATPPVTRPTVFSPEVAYGIPVADRFDFARNRGNVVGTRQQRVLISAIYQTTRRQGPDVSE